MYHRPLTLRKHAGIAALTRDVQAPYGNRVLMHLDVVGHGMLNKRHRYHRVLFGRGKVAQDAHMICGAVLTVATLHILHEILAHARAVHARHMHRIPVFTQTIVRVIKETRIPRGVAGQDRRRRVARHTARRGLEDAGGNTAGLVGNQKHRRRVHPSERLRLFRARGAARYKRALWVALQLNAVRLELQQIVKGRLQPLGDIFHLSEAGVEKLGRRGGGHNGLARHAHQNVPYSRQSDPRGLPDAVARTNAYTPYRGGCDGVEELDLPLVRLDAGDLAGEGDGVVAVARH